MFWQWLFLGDHKFLWFVFAFAIFNDIFLSSLCDMYGTGSNNTISLVNSLMKESYTFWAPDQASIQQFILTSLVGTVTRKHVWLSYTMVDSFILVIFYYFLFIFIFMYNYQNFMENNEPIVFEGVVLSLRALICQGKTCACLLTNAWLRLSLMLALLGAQCWCFCSFLNTCALKNQLHFIGFIRCTKQKIADNLMKNNKKEV